MYSIEELVATLIATELAEEYIKETRADVPANDVSNHEKIIENTKEHVYLPWKEAWDAENEDNLKYEEFENKSIGGNASFTIETITSANQALQEIKINRLYVPIKNNISIRFTNSSGGALWAKHIWRGVKMKRTVYNRYVKPHIDRMLEEMMIQQTIGVF